MSFCKCLNPCFNGRYSQSFFCIQKERRQRLNPCFNGRYSQRTLTKLSRTTTQSVLILVLMEDTLRVLQTLQIIYVSQVLILVLMEDTLRDIYFYTYNK